MPAEIRDTIREIEKDAEKLIEKARTEARGILEDTNKKAREILSSEVFMDEVESERGRIVSEAEEEAKKEIEKSKETSKRITSKVATKIDTFSQLMADQIRGIN